MSYVGYSPQSVRKMRSQFLNRYPRIVPHVLEIADTNQVSACMDTQIPEELEIR
jgi:hypothetical protein